MKLMSYSRALRVFQKTLTVQADVSPTRKVAFCCKTVIKLMNKKDNFIDVSSRQHAAINNHRRTLQLFNHNFAT